MIEKGSVCGPQSDIVATSDTCIIQLSLGQEEENPDSIVVQTFNVG